MTEHAYANPDALVSADWLTAHLDDPGVRVVEVDVSPKSYAEGHIPGAVFWDVYKHLKDTNYRLVDAKAFESILSAVFGRRPFTEHGRQGAEDLAIRSCV